MLTIADIRDYIASLDISNNVYCGRLDDKKDKSIGVYPLKQNRARIEGIGADASYNIKGISILVHWNKSIRDTEKVAYDLYNKLSECREVTTSDSTIKFTKHINNDPIPVFTDDKGIFEYVIEILFYYER